MKKLKIIISGGGTGGHIFPALAIANELREQMPGADILFVGALNKMEMERVPEAGFSIVGLPVMGFPRKPSINTLRFLMMLFKSMQKAKRIIRDFKPDLVVGVGGFASGPILRAAVGKGIPAILQEQNSYAGLTNKLLSKKVNKICVAYPNMERYFPKEKLVLTGNPVRKNLLENKSPREECLSSFGLNDGQPVLLIVGGSLGARTLNDSVLANIEQIRESNVQIIWQTGKIYHAEMVQKLGDNIPKNLKMMEFLSNMDMAYKVADLVVSRAGAGTISELCLLGKPAILVPSPNVAEDHQTKNALALVEGNAAQMVTDHQAKTSLFETAFGLINNKTQLQIFSDNMKKLAKPNATKEIVQVILNELKR